MKTRIIDQSSLSDALELLRGGGVVGIPTDTVYGIAAMPLDAAAIDAVYAAKDRPLDKALPMLVASISDAERIAELDADALRLVTAFWPGALTVVAMASRGFRSPAIAEDGSVAVR